MELGIRQESNLLEGVHGGEFGKNGMSEQSISALGNYVTAIFKRNESHRIACGIEEELTECLYQSTSRYLPDELEKIRKIGVRPVYFPYTAVKINAAQAWISEIFLNTTEKTYVLRPTPLPELTQLDTRMIVMECLREWIENRGGLPDNPDDRITLFYYILNRRDEMHNKTHETARERAANMERLINDQFLEGGWKDALSDLIEDISTYGTGVLKGPEMRMRKRIRHEAGENGETTCVVDWKLVPEWRHLDPFDCYPSPGAVDINDGAFCHKVRMLPKDLSAMRGVQGYNTAIIDGILSRYPNGGLTLNGNSDAAIRENRNDGGTADTIFLEGFEFWGECRGEDLLNWGVITDINGTPLDPDKFYETNAIVFGGEVVYCALVDERLGRPFYKGVFYSTAGSWWGYGPAKIMRDIQHEMNAAKRNLVYNMAMASGPIKVINNINALQNPKDAEVTIPWQTIPCKQTLGMPTNGRPVIEFLVTPSIMAELSNELEVCMKHADTVTGIPAYSHGSNVAAGAGRTAQGLAMLMDAAQRGIKQVIFNLDKDVMRPSVTYMYRLNLLTSNDPSIKGDCEIDAGGLLAIISRDKNLNLIKEFLVLAQDPAKAQVMGEEGVAALMREYAKLLQYVNVDDIVPTKEQIEARKQAQMQEQMMMAQMQQQGGGAPQMPGAPAPMAGLPPNMGANPDPANMGQFQPNGVQAQMTEGPM